MSTVFQSWQNQNRYRSYPFRDDTSLASDEDPDISIPHSLIIDFAISVPVEVNTPGLVSADSVGVRLSGLMYSEPRLVFFFVKETGEALATATISDLDSHVPGKAYDVYGTGNFTDVRGTITLGSLDDLRAQVPAGSYNFSGAVMEMCTVRPALNGVRSIRVGAGTAVSDPLYGIVSLVEGSNVKLTYIPEDNAIRFDAIRSDDFNEDCTCSEAAATKIQTINGISVAHLRIEGDDCVSVKTAGNTITITDKCSFPCCGCEELDFITTRLKFLETAISKIEGFATTLATVVPTSVGAMKYLARSGGTLTVSNIQFGSQETVIDPDEDPPPEEDPES